MWNNDGGSSLTVEIAHTSIQDSDSFGDGSNGYQRTPRQLMTALKLKICVRKTVKDVITQGDDDYSADGIATTQVISHGNSIINAPRSGNEVLR